MSEAAVSAELRACLRRLKLSPILATLAERLRLARERNLSFEELLTLILAAECERRDQLATDLRLQKARLDPAQHFETWERSTSSTYDRELVAELETLRFIEEHHNVLILGPVGVGKTHLASALGHLACRRGYSVLLMRTEALLKALRAARLDRTVERELRRFIAVDLLILDDFGLDTLDATESRDVYEVLLERHQRRSTIVTSNRDPDEWLATMSDPLRAQSVIDRLKNNAYELVLEGESYRSRQKPTLSRQRSQVAGRSSR